MTIPELYNTLLYLTGIFPVYQYCLVRVNNYNCCNCHSIFNLYLPNFTVRNIKKLEGFADKTTPGF